MLYTNDKIELGDLVGVPSSSWISNTVGLVVNIKNIVHAESGTGYTAITAVFNNETYTFSEKDFTLISKATTHD
tara:strand:- start:515 stop:736 length:222 start_codon:yes stop_codon:yes gene_type:complete